MESFMHTEAKLTCKSNSKQPHFAKVRNRFFIVAWEIRLR